VNQSHRAPSANRIITWRYRTAVQAARMLNRVAAGPRVERAR
jgi:hypothetical protein